MSGPRGRGGEAPAADNTLSPKRTGDRSCTGRLACSDSTVAERFPPFGPTTLDSSAVFTPSAPNINAGEMVKNPARVQNGLHRGNSKGRARFYAGRALCLPRRAPGVARMACALGPGLTAPQFRGSLPVRRSAPRGRRSFRERRLLPSLRALAGSPRASVNRARLPPLKPAGRAAQTILHINAAASREQSPAPTRPRPPHPPPQGARF